MRKLPSVSILVLFLATPASLYGQDCESVPTILDQRRLIQFPDTSNYKTIVLDPHTHSVFSDGYVWPCIRVEEALRDGLDALAITEHLEWQPHLADIPHPDRNRSYEVAVSAIEESELIVIAGVEVTREVPHGHINALFISDANKMFANFTPEDPKDIDGYYDTTGEWPAQNAVDAANAQGAFLFWNHSWWDDEIPSFIPQAGEFQITNAKNNLLHGIEIVNTNSYSKEAFQIALDLQLTLMGSSDVHELIDWDYDVAEGGHRPVTLVLATERSEESIREALFEGRTVVWFKNTLFGYEPHMAELLQASLTVSSSYYTGKLNVLVLEVENHSDSDFQLKNISGYSFFGTNDTIAIPQHQITQIGVKTGTRVEKVSLEFEVQNALVKPGKYATIVLSSDEIDIRE